MIGLAFGNFQSGGGGFDPDAQAAITAIGADATIGGYLNQLFLDLKGQGNTTNGTDVYSKCYAIYPMSPSDASTISLSTTKWNVKDPRDLDAAFRITWVSTPVASLSLGVTQNGSNNGYGNTHFIESANMVAGNNGFTFSVSDLPSGGNHYMGGSNSTTTFAQRMAFNASWGVFSAGQIINSAYSLGVNTGVRRSATDFELYRNGVSVGINARSASAQSTGNFYLLALESAGSAGSFFNDGAIDFVVIHNGLTAEEAKDLYDSINAWKTSLGR